MGRARSPAADLEKDGMQLAAPVRKLIERAAGAAPLHDAARLQLLETLRQHVRAGPESHPEIAEALRPVQELADDEQGPALPDDVERPGDGARVSVTAQARHEWNRITCIPEQFSPKVGLQARAEQAA